MQRLDHRADDGRRGLERLDGRFRGYFARFLGLPFVAVMPASTSPEKIALIEEQGGTCHLVDDPRTMVAEAQRLAVECDGHFLDQFTYAERATDWRGNNNIAESIFSQMALEPHPVPAWVVVGAGTGGTSATIGRFTRLMRYPTRLCVVDPEDSIFYSSWTGDPSTFTGRPSPAGRSTRSTPNPGKKSAHLAAVRYVRVGKLRKAIKSTAPVKVTFKLTGAKANAALRKIRKGKLTRMRITTTFTNSAGKTSKTVKTVKLRL